MRFKQLHRSLHRKCRRDQQYAGGWVQLPARVPQAWALLRAWALLVPQAWALLRAWALPLLRAWALPLA